MSSDVRFTVFVGSGKGGVGKSTVSLNLALALAARGAACGILDADLHGPSIPLMLGMTPTRSTRFWTVASKGQWRRLTPTQHAGLAVMSFGTVLGEDQPMALEGPGLSIIARQLCEQIDWGTLDVLVVDLPPGTGDILQTLMPVMRPAAAVIVVTPQDIAHLDARKALQAYRMGGVEVLGGVENMSELACPHCGEAFPIFPRVDDARSLWQRGVDRLGSIPFDPRLASAADTGKPVVLSAPESDVGTAFARLAERVAASIAAHGG